jgi:metal-responsive CopG/Arc/MetJ family transcriptional regulator
MTKKMVVSVSMSPYLKKRLEEIAEREGFTGLSDVVSYALIEFVSRYDRKEKVGEVKL